MFFGAVVHTCTQGRQIDEKYGLKPFDDKLECADNEDELISKVRVYSMVMAQIFNADIWLEDRRLDTVFV